MKKALLPIVIILTLVAGGAAGYLAFFRAPQVTEPSYFAYEPGGYFLTNVKDSKSYLKTTIVFQIKEDDLQAQQEFLAANEHIIRDEIVFMLREKTYDELRSSTIKQTLSGEIAQRIRTRLDIDYVEAIYFSEYVVQ